MIRVITRIGLVLSVIIVFWQNSGICMPDQKDHDIVDSIEQKFKGANSLFNLLRYKHSYLAHLARFFPISVDEYMELEKYRSALMTELQEEATVLGAETRHYQAVLNRIEFPHFINFPPRNGLRIYRYSTTGIASLAASSDMREWNRQRSVKDKGEHPDLLVMVEYNTDLKDGFRILEYDLAD